MVRDDAVRDRQTEAEAPVLDSAALRTTLMTICAMSIELIWTGSGSRVESIVSSPPVLST